jgi:superoxide reductase
MKRREFLASVGAGATALGMSTAVSADDKVKKKSKRKYPREKRSQVYYCEICGAVAEILEPGRPPIVHCGEPMILLEEQVEGDGQDKHVPVIEKIDGGYRVKIGKVPHPMTRSHFIGFVELIHDGRVSRHYLEQGEKPVVEFVSDARPENVTARAWCNLHGLWKHKPTEMAAKK